jgi:hypothetical protein
VSEYQYYEFRVVDRPLNQRQMDELRKLSTRAEITPTSFTNEYHWGDFRGDPAVLMQKYFDAFVYVANWGTRRFMLRLPLALIDGDEVRPYADGECLSLKAGSEFVVLHFGSDEEGGGDWEQGEGWLGELLPVREGLMAGDLRSLYLAWLRGLDYAEPDDDTPEPPRPPGLGKLSPALQRFVEFLRIDPDLIEAAAADDAGAPPAGPTHDELAAWVAARPEAEKNALLVRLAEDDALSVRGELLRDFRQAWKRSRSERGQPTATEVPRRTVGQLLAARDAIAAERRRREEEQKARERERQAREQARKRAEHLDALARREAAAWRQVETLIATKRPKDYDQAVELLKDLRDVAERAGRRDKAVTRIRQLREQHAGKPSLMKRFDQAGLEA